MSSNQIDPRLQYGSLPPPQHYGNAAHGGHPQQLPSLSSGNPTQPYYRLPPTLPQHHSPLAPFEHARHHSQGYQNGSQEQYGEDVGSPHSQEGDDPNDPKRARACEACRGLKVRCDRDPNRPDLPCKRCAKAKRACIITAPTRKRQKKTDSRVAELEKKIDALTASLNAQNKDETGGSEVGTSPASDPSPHHNYPTPGSVQPRNHPYHQVPTPPGGRAPASNGYDNATNATSSKRPRVESTQDTYNEARAPPRKRAEVERNVFEDDTETRRLGIIEDIDSLIDAPIAERIFERYCSTMAHQLPAVVFPKGTRASDVKSQKPILYLSILVAASVGMAPIDVQQKLSMTLTSTFADSIIKRGDKSLEIVQALIIMVIWYRPPKRFEQMNFYQLGHIAAVMCIDIGIGKASSPKRTPTNNTKRVPCFRHLVDPTTLEARRAWMGVYFLTLNTSMSLRRPDLIRWSAYMDESIQALESATDALPSDRALCQQIKIQGICEAIGEKFKMFDPSASVTIADQKIQEDLKELEGKLKDWAVNVPEDCWNTTLRFHQNITDIYMHELALHTNHNVDDFRAPFTEESLKAVSEQSDALSPTHQSAILECKAAVHATFRAFFDYEHHALGAAPIFYFVRIAYAVVVLLKLYFSAANPSTFVSKVVSAEELEVESHLDSLLRLLHSVAEDESFRPANKFLAILNRMRGWFVKGKESRQKAGVTGGSADPNGRFNPHQQNSSRQPHANDNGTFRQQQQQQQPKTPLAFLSEVAASADAQPSSAYPGQHTGSGTSPASTSVSSGPYNPQTTYQPSRTPTLTQTQPPTPWYNSNMNPLDNGGNGQMQPPQVPLGMANDYGAGSGFEQAMDWTLNMTMDSDDLNSLFMMGDPSFFGAFDFGDMGAMTNVPGGQPQSLETGAGAQM